MARPMRALAAAALTVAIVGGATTANAATPASGPAQLAHAAAEARANAGAALGGITMPTSAVRSMRAAVANPVQTIHETIRVKVASKRYDVRVVSTGAKSDRERITLYVGTHPETVSVRRYVRVTVIRHGHHHVPLLETTTTFRRFVVMVTGLQSNPLSFTATHFSTRSAFVSALAHGLAIDGAEVNKEYGAVLRFAQMSLDIAASLLEALQQAGSDPTSVDLSTVKTVQTTAGTGGYQGSVTLSGTLQAFTATATNDTDASVLTETVSQDSFSLTYTVGGKTYTLGLS